MSDMQPQGVFKPPADLKTFHETTDLDLKGVVIFTIALIVVCATALFGLKIMMNQFAADAADAKARTLPRRGKVDMFHPRPGSTKTAASEPEPEAKPAEAKAKADSDAGAKP